MTTSPDSAELAAAIRLLAKRLHRYELGVAGRGQVLEHLRAADELLRVGDERLRWYEQPDGPDPTKVHSRDLSPFSGRLNAVAPPMDLSLGELDDGRSALVGHVKLDRLREGPPHSTHGGVLAGLFDEILGAGQRLTNRPGGVTGRLTVKFRKPTPLDEDLMFRSWIHDDRHRRLVVRADCRVRNPDSSVAGSRELLTAEAEAIFVRVDFLGMEKSMRARGSGAASTTAPPPDSAASV